MYASMYVHMCGNQNHVKINNDKTHQNLKLKRIDFIITYIYI